MVHILIKQNMRTNMWTQTTSYGDIEIKWEYKKQTAEKETYTFVFTQ